VICDKPIIKTIKACNDILGAFQEDALLDNTFFLLGLPHGKIRHCCGTLRAAGKTACPSFTKFDATQI
jgi:hypothetical protein